MSKPPDKNCEGWLMVGTSPRHWPVLISLWSFLKAPMAAITNSSWPSSKYFLSKKNLSLKHLITRSEFLPVSSTASLLIAALTGSGWGYHELDCVQQHSSLQVDCQESGFYCDVKKSVGLDWLVFGQTQIHFVQSYCIWRSLTLLLSLFCAFL